MNSGEPGRLQALPEDWQRALAIVAHPAAHAVDITETFDHGIASLQAHTAYLAALEGAMGQPSEFLESLARSNGTALGTRFASAFEVLVIRAEVS